jgi:hypothetical protein
MIPKDPVYKLHGAIKRIEDAMPNEDAEGWLRDKLAADHIGWAYRQIEEQHGRRWTSFIDIPPRAAIMEEPDLEIDWSKGMATIQQRYSRGISGSKIRKKPVECEIVISLRDLDRELANATQSRPGHPADAETFESKPDRPASQLGRPRKWNWDQFDREVTRIANTPDGLPENHADLVRTMSSWCLDTWGNEPPDSSIRDRISATYRHITEYAEKS